MQTHLPIRFLSPFLKHKLRVLLKSGETLSLGARPRLRLVHRITNNSIFSMTEAAKACNSQTILTVQSQFYKKKFFLFIKF